MDKNKHKLYMAQILSLIFKDKDLCNIMAFKGGTSLMFFHNLNRFSTDLDFNLLVQDKINMVYDKVRAILTRFGTIDDEAKKLYGPVLVLNYGKGERMPKVEISTRQFPNHYEMRSLAGTMVRMQGLGEVLNDSKTKAFVRNKLIDETASALELFSAFPLISKQD